MTAWTPLVVVLGMVRCLSCEGAAIPMDTYVQVVSSVWQHYHACAVVILQCGSFQAEPSRLRRRLSDVGIPTVATHAHLGGKALDPCPSNRALFVVLAGTPHALSQVATTRSLSNPRWLVFHDAVETHDVFRAVAIPFDCEVVAGRWHEATVLLSEVYRAGPHMPLVVRVWGHWSSEGGLVAPTEPLPSRRNNLHGAAIRAGVKEYNPMLMLGRKEGKVVIVGGFFGNVWTILEQQLNFTTELVQPPDGKWGLRDQDDRWNGLIGMIQREEIDIVITGYGLTTERAHVADFSQPLQSSSAYVHMRVPDAANVSWTSVFAPFSNSLWASIGCAIIGLTAALSALHRTGRMFCERGLPTHSVADTLHFVCGIFCMQGLANRQQTQSFMLLSWCAYLTAVVLSTAYSSCLVAFMSIRTVELPVSSFSDLLSSDHYRLGVMDSSATLSLLKGATDPELKAVLQLVTAEESLPITQLEGVQRVCNLQDYTFFTGRENILPYFKSIPCRVAKLPQTRIHFHTGMVYPKHSPYYTVISAQLERMRQTGVLKVLYKHAWPTREEPPDYQEPTSVQIKSVAMFFFVLSFGVLASLLLLGMEVHVRGRD